MNGKTKQPLRSLRTPSGPAYHPHQARGLRIQPGNAFLLATLDTFPRDQVQVTEMSEQPGCAHTKLLLLIQHGMLQILYSMNIYSLQKWLPNH